MQKQTVATPLRQHTNDVKNNDSEPLRQLRNDPTINASDALETT